MKKLLALVVVLLLLSLWWTKSSWSSLLTKDPGNHTASRSERDLPYPAERSGRTIKEPRSGSAIISGTVTDRATGEAISGAEVTFFEPDNAASAFKDRKKSYYTKVQSGEDGRYELKLSETGTYSVSAIQLETLASFEGKVDVEGEGEGEMNLKLKDPEVKEKEVFQLLGVNVTPLAPTYTRTFDLAKNGGLLINEKMEKGLFDSPLGIWRSHYRSH
ncbi:MAG: carboxypeptidase-like regulatory domain-containing protein [Akkermansiaceae bacterium]